MPVTGMKCCAMSPKSIIIVSSVQKQEDQFSSHPSSKGGTTEELVNQNQQGWITSGIYLTAVMMKLR